MRLRVLSLMLFVNAACCLLGQAHAADQTAPDQRLQQPTTVKADRVPIKTIIDELARKHDLQVTWSKRCIRQDYLNMSVSLNISGIQLQSALNLLCQSLGLEYLLENGQLLMLSRTEAYEMLVEQKHALAELRPLHATVGEFTDSIRQATSGQWKDIDGVGGLFARWDESDVVVLQTRAVHAEIDDLFAQLKAQVTGRPRPLTSVELANNRLLAVLNQPTRWKAGQSTLSAALELIARPFPGKLVIHHSAIAAARIDPDQINVALEDTAEPAATLLSRICAERKLSWFVADEVLQLTTRIRADERLVTRVYNIRGRPMPEYSPTELADAADLLATLNEIEGFRPWARIDGVGGTISNLGPLLVIRQNRAVHEKLAKFFSDRP